MNENSYIKQHFEHSPWYNELDRVLDHCSACFFVGYSLSDYHIAALLLQKPSRRGKIYFIVTSAPDDISGRQLEQFGEIHAIGAAGFSNLCKILPAPPAVADLSSLRSLRYIDPFRDKKAVIPPTSSEVLRLVTYGEFNFQRCLTNLPSANYVVPRTELAERVVEELQKATTIILHSFLGNGKTVFMPILAYHLSTRGKKCFQCLSTGAETLRETQALQGQKDVVILIDSYDLAITAIPILEEALPESKYVVTVRTGVHEVRLHEIHEKLPEPIRRIGLNGISKGERADFRRILDEAGVLGSTFDANIGMAVDFREVVTSIYNHEGIRGRIASEIAPLLSDTKTCSIVVTSLLLSWIGQSMGPALLRAVTERDPYVELRRHQAVASEIFKLEDDQLEVRSAVFAEYILRMHCTAEQILENIEKLLVVAVQRKRERGFQAVLSKLMRVAGLKELLSGPDRFQRIERLFQRLQRDIGINAEPLFWLQHAILSSEMGNLEQAEKFLETAYGRAASSRNFETFQIDTYALHLLLEIETQGGLSDITRFDDIMQKTELVLSMITDENRRRHAIQVLGDFEPFVRARGAAMLRSERNAVVFQLNRLQTGLDGLALEIKAETGSEIIKRSLASASAFLVNLPT